MAAPTFFYSLTTYVVCTFLIFRQNWDEKNVEDEWLDGASLCLEDAAKS